MRGLYGSHGRAAAAASHRFPLAAGQREYFRIMRASRAQTPRSIYCPWSKVYCPNDVKQKIPGPSCEDSGVLPCLHPGGASWPRTHFPQLTPPWGFRQFSPFRPSRVPSPNLTAEDRVKRLQAGLLTLGSFYSPPLPVPEITLLNSGLRGFRPRLQRRVRPRFSRGSLSELCSDIPATESNALASKLPAHEHTGSAHHPLYLPRHAMSPESMQKNPPNRRLREILTKCHARGSDAKEAYRFPGRRGGSDPRHTQNW
jgi:hypothetical protein